jgi:hypothetical protein
MVKACKGVADKGFAAIKAHLGVGGPDHSPMILRSGIWKGPLKTLRSSPEFVPQTPRKRF